MSNNGDEPQQEVEPTPLVPGGPEDCQKCGTKKPFPSAKFAKAGPNGKLLMAVMCMDCLIAEHGLEWREAKPSTIVVPGRRQEAVH